jgi:hypothetical protein
LNLRSIKIKRIFHFRRNKYLNEGGAGLNKKTIGWVVLGLVVLGAVGFASYHIYQEKVIQSENETKKTLNARLTNLYEDQKSGYFKADISASAFDDLATEVKKSARGKQNAGGH